MPLHKTTKFLCRDAMNGFWPIRCSKRANSYIDSGSAIRIRIGLMELNSRETATTRRGERGGGHWMAEETRPSWSKIVYLEACAHSARAICTASPISDAAYFTLTVKVFGLCSKILGIYIYTFLHVTQLLVGTWEKKKKVSGHYFVGGSIVHQCCGAAAYIYHPTVFDSG